MQPSVYNTLTQGAMSSRMTVYGTECVMCGYCCAVTAPCVQALEEEASLRQAARLNALLAEAQQLGGEVDRILGEGEGAGGEGGTGTEDRAGGGGGGPQAGAAKEPGVAATGAAAGVA